MLQLTWPIHPRPVDCASRMYGNWRARRRPPTNGSTEDFARVDLSPRLAAACRGSCKSEERGLASSLPRCEEDISCAVASLHRGQPSEVLSGRKGRSATLDLDEDDFEEIAALVEPRGSPMILPDCQEIDDPTRFAPSPACESDHLPASSGAHLGRPESRSASHDRDTPLSHRRCPACGLDRLFTRTRRAASELLAATAVGRSPRSALDRSAHSRRASMTHLSSRSS